MSQAEPLVFCTLPHWGHQETGLLSVGDSTIRCVGTQHICSPTNAWAWYSQVQGLLVVMSGTRSPRRRDKDLESL